MPTAAATTAIQYELQQAGAGFSGAGVNTYDVAVYSSSLDGALAHLASIASDPDVAVLAELVRELVAQTVSIGSAGGQVTTAAGTIAQASGVLNAGG